MFSTPCPLHVACVCWYTTSQRHKDTKCFCNQFSKYRVTTRLLPLCSGSSHTCICIYVLDSHMALVKPCKVSSKKCSGFEGVFEVLLSIVNQTLCFGAPSRAKCSKTLCFRAPSRAKCSNTLCFAIAQSSKVQQNAMFPSAHSSKVQQNAVFSSAQ